MNEAALLEGRIAALKAKTIARKAENRQVMPLTTAIVDDLRAVFGKLPYGRFTENGRTAEWGKRTVEGTAVEASEVVK